MVNLQIISASSCFTLNLFNMRKSKRKMKQVLCSPTQAKSHLVKFQGRNIISTVVLLMMLPGLKSSQTMFRVSNKLKTIFANSSLVTVEGKLDIVTASSWGYLVPI